MKKKTPKKKKAIIKKKVAKKKPTKKKVVAKKKVAKKKSRAPKANKPIGTVTHFYNEISVAIVRFKSRFSSAQSSTSKEHHRLPASPHLHAIRPPTDYQSPERKANRDKS